MKEEVCGAGGGIAEGEVVVVVTLDICNMVVEGALEEGLISSLFAWRCR